MTGQALNKVRFIQKFFEYKIGNEDASSCLNTGTGILILKTIPKILVPFKYLMMKVFEKQLSAFVLDKHSYFCKKARNITCVKVRIHDRYTSRNLGIEITLNRNSSSTTRGS